MPKNKLRAPRPRQRRPGHIYSRTARIISDDSSTSSQPSMAEKAKNLIDGFKDPTKVFHAGVDKAVRERIRRMHSHFPLPQSIRSVMDPRVSRVVVINRDGHSRDLLPDVPSRHVMLCHASVARVIESGIGIFSRITTASDGSWVLRPAGIDMLNQTTVQHVRRRRLWFLRRYGYEISFDGRVEPAMMLFDYGLDPTRRRQVFYVSHERVPIRGSEGKFNTFFRFWLDRHNIGQ